MRGTSPQSKSVICRWIAHDSSFRSVAKKDKVDAVANQLAKNGAADVAQALKSCYVRKKNRAGKDFAARQLAEISKKDAIGKLWAAQDRQKYVHATIYKTKDGMTVEQQIVTALVQS